MAINLEHEAMRAAQRDVARASERLARGRAAADSTVTGLLDSGWRGRASDSFRDAWEDWKVAADQVKAGLDSMELLLGAVHRDMIDQDAGSQASLDAIAARIVDRLG